MRRRIGRGEIGDMMSRFSTSCAGTLSQIPVDPGIYSQPVAYVLMPLEVVNSQMMANLNMQFKLTSAPGIF